MTTLTLILILASHFIGDFLLQNNWMALGKSKRLAPLAAHAAVYGAGFLWLGLPFALLTFALHGATDAITSRITARLWFVSIKHDKWGPDTLLYHDSKRHWFFVMIGFDQLIHYVTLIWTYNLVIQ